jgi:predicted transcriptional regulator
VRKRDREEIAIDILEAALTPQKKMRIMYRANLNFDRFNRYFYELLRKGFIEKADDPDDRPFYRISERGKTLLVTLKMGRDLLSSDEY